MNVEQLKSFPLLAGFDDADIASLTAAATVAEVGAGATLLRMGDANVAIHLILAGAAKVTRQGTEGEFVLNELVAGQAFGEVSFIDGSRATATVTATGPTTVLKIGAASVDALRDANPRAWGTLWRNIALQLRRSLTLSTDLVDQLTDENQILRDPALRNYYSAT